MPYLSNTPADQQAMLAAIGVKSVADLFEMVPPELRLERSLALPPAMTEMELHRHLSELAARNPSAATHACFLGAGSYDHFVPAVVDTIAARGEFYTSYTPYQAEASQGNLQVFFEYQTLVTQLTGLDVSNASLYDGASAAAEAMLMTLHATGRKRLVVAGSVHPEYRQVLATYLRHLGVEIVTVAPVDGTLPLAQLEAAVNDQTAGVLVQHPNFFGCLEPVDEVARIAHQAGAMVVAAFDPISLGLLKRPGEWGADIAVAEGQPLGTPLSFGGPYLGVMACREELVRRMPGRITGQTVDRQGRRAWVLTLQTREQHIRREKANSNICTNQGLLALRATVYLATMGPQGLREVAELCLQKSHYAADRLAATGLPLAWDRPFFKEFVVRVPGDSIPARLAQAAAAGLLGPLPLGRWYPELADCLLVAVTEKRTRGEIDRLAQALSETSSKGGSRHA